MFITLILSISRKPNHFIHSRLYINYKVKDKYIFKKKLSNTLKETKAHMDMQSLTWFTVWPLDFTEIVLTHIGARAAQWVK